MALSHPDVIIWQFLKENNLIPPKPSVLEIGEANWYGDVPLPSGIDYPFGGDSFAIAKAFYRAMMDYSHIAAIDLQGKTAHKFDLNEPLPADFESDIVINTGTAEHCFDQRRVFQTIHECCNVKGLMFHAAPWTGWANHGLVNYQPEVFTSLAKVNNYDPLVLQVWDVGRRQLCKWLPEKYIPAESLLYAVFRKTKDEPFRVPIQTM